MSTFIKNIGAVDWLIFGIAAFMVFRGFCKGCSGEIGSLVGILLAAAAGFFGFTPVSRAVFSISLLNANQHAGRPIVFIIMLVLCFSIWLIVSRLLTDGIRLVLKQPFDAVVGGVIGGIKAFALIIVICMFEIIKPQTAENNNAGEKSSYTTKKMSPLIKRIKFFE